MPGWASLRSPLVLKETVVKQNELNRAVSHATGESVDRIQRIGFNLVVVPTVTVRRRRWQRRRTSRTGSPVQAELKSLVPQVS